jgi:hypothetical protein
VEVGVAGGPIRDAGEGMCYENFLKTWVEILNKIIGKN